MYKAFAQTELRVFDFQVTVSNMDSKHESASSCICYATARQKGTEAAHLQFAACQIATTAKICRKGILDQVELCTAEANVPMPLITLASGSI